MKIFSVYRERNIFKVSVYDSFEDFVKRSEWQDSLGDYFIIIDKDGNIYKWDESKTEEFATTYNYTLVINKKDTEFGNLCQRNYELNNFADEFCFEL